MNSPMWSLVSSAATRWLMYSEPLSAWKPLTWKGKALMEGFELGDEEVLGDAADGSKVVELRHFVDDVDDVDPLLAALVDGVDAEEAGPPVGPGLAAGADGHRGRRGRAEGEAAEAVRPGRAEVVDVPLEMVARRSKRVSPKTSYCRRRTSLSAGPEGCPHAPSTSASSAMSAAGIAAREGPRPGLLAVVAYVAGPAVLRDQPAQLRWGQAGHLAQELPDPAFVRPPKAVVVLEPDQRPPDEGVGGVAVRKVEVRRLVTLQEGAELVERPNPFGAKCHDHPPRMSSPLGSCSLLAGNPSPAHAHLSLEKDWGLTDKRITVPLTPGPARTGR